MTTTQLSILRAIVAHQPILKEDLYKLLNMRLNSAGHYIELMNLRQQGYIQYGRHKGPVWLTIKGREASKLTLAQAYELSLNSLKTFEREWNDYVDEEGVIQ